MNSLHPFLWFVIALVSVHLLTFALQILLP